MRFVGSFFLLSVAFISGYWLNTNFSFSDSSITQDLSPKTKVNRDKPYLEKKFSDLNGDLVSLKKWEAKLTVINFWGTWCPPCKEEMPLLSRLSEKFKYKNVQFIREPTISIRIQPNVASSFLSLVDISYDFKMYFRKMINFKIQI